MQFKRSALLAFSAFSLAACGSDDKSPTGNSGLNDAQRLAVFGDFVEAGGNAAQRGAENAFQAFYFAGFSALFGAATANISVGSNGAFYSVAGNQPNFATAGNYEVVAMRINSTENYGGGEVDQYEFSVIVAFRDTSEVIWAFGEGTGQGSFGAGEAEGGIYSAPNKEWIATSGTASLGAANQGGNCDISNSIRQAIESEVDEGGALTSFTCKVATFNGSINMTGSQPNANASGSRTATLSGTIPGVVLSFTYDYTGAR